MIEVEPNKIRGWAIVQLLSDDGNCIFVKLMINEKWNCEYNRPAIEDPEADPFSSMKHFIPGEVSCKLTLEGKPIESEVTTVTPKWKLRSCRHKKSRREGGAIWCPQCGSVKTRFGWSHPNNYQLGVLT